MRIGRRVREVRTWRGMSVTATAGLAGVSVSYLSMIERGERAVTKRSVLESLARALRVHPAELIGRPYDPFDEIFAGSRDAVVTLSDVLSGWWIGEVPDAPVRPWAEVLDDVRTLTALRAVSDFAAQVDLLPGLIRELLVAAADPRTEREALVPLISAYFGAGNIATRLGFPGLPALAADRIRRVAERLDDPVWTAVAAWGRAKLLSDTSRSRQYELAVAAAEQAPLERPETRGMCHLTAALASAAQGDADLAQTHLGEAEAMADQLSVMTSLWPAGLMNFGRTNVGIWRVCIGVELGWGAQVAEVAEQVRPETITPSRQAAFWMDYGRGLLTERRTRDEGVRALLRAEELAPQQVRCNVWVREAVVDLLTSGRTAGGDLRRFALRLGIAPNG
nr:XRE family transcriptional regulator [Actinophytocola xanthii]